MDQRTKVSIFMGKTDVGAAKHKQQSMVIVPLDAPGVTLTRYDTIFNCVVIIEFTLGVWKV